MSNLLREIKSWEKGSKNKKNWSSGRCRNRGVWKQGRGTKNNDSLSCLWHTLHLKRIYTHTHSHTHSRMHPHKLIQRDAKKSAFSFPFMKWRKNGKGNIEFVPYFDSAWNVCLNGYMRYINGNLYDFVFLYINHCQDSFASKLYKQIECVLCNTYFQMIYDRCQIFNIKYETFYNYYIYAAHTRFA